jgi:hypothetical protein
MSAFGGRADIGRMSGRCRLLTESGHWDRPPDQTRSDGEFVLGRYTNGSDRDTLVSVYSLLMSEK